MVKSLHRDSSPQPGSPTERSNALLACLPDDELKYLRPKFQYKSFAFGHVLHEPNQAIRAGVFVVEGLISRMAVMESGAQVEVGLVGKESLIGSQVLLGSDRSNWRTMIQATPTLAYCLEVEELRKAFRELPRFQQLVLQHIRAQTAIVTQIAACNCIHDADQRMARWLLMCQDRLGANMLPLTQELLGLMLGVQRTTVTMVAGQMHDAGLISYTRGKITVLDRGGLERAACECYPAVKAQHVSLLHEIG